MVIRQRVAETVVGIVATVPIWSLNDCGVAPLKVKREIPRKISSATLILNLFTKRLLDGISSSIVFSWVLDEFEVQPVSHSR